MSVADSPSIDVKHFSCLFQSVANCSGYTSMGGSYHQVSGQTTTGRSSRLLAEIEIYRHSKIQQGSQPDR